MSNSAKSNLQVEFSTKLKNISDSPGVYLFKNIEGKIIYIGKAKSLKKRVRSYFSRTINHPRTRKLVSLIADIETLATDSELEALILESNLIKENQPRYNVNLKDDKRYPYIKITNEVYPRVLVVRQVNKDKAKYFGPYTQVGAMRQTMKLIRKIFPIRSCNLTIPSPRKYKVCLDFFIDKCPGCCEPDRTTPEEYHEIIEGVILMLSGRSDEVIEILTAKMIRHSDKQEYEKAAAVRDQVRALQKVIEKQKVVTGDLINRDIIVVARAIKDVCVVVLQIRKGILIGRQHFYLTAPEETKTSEILSSFVIRYYKNTSFLPSEIFVPEEIDEPELIILWFIAKKCCSVKILQPQKGEKLKLVGLAEKNAKLLLYELLAEKSIIKMKPPAILLSLQRDLYLKSIPRTIAACDISNLGGSDAVGSVIFFSEAKPLKKSYRRFKIKTVEGQDDYSMMAEVVSRYYNHLVENNMDYPDLLLIDGGKGQLGAALNVLSDLGITSQQCASLAKQFEEVYLPGRPEPISIPRTSSALRLLQHVRDEAHRFAISYHRKLRSKKVAASELDNIPGVGDKRKYILLGALGSVEAIKNARLQDILNISGIPKTLAVKIYEHFHPGDTDE